MKAVEGVVDDRRPESGGDNHESKREIERETMVV